ncbi:MAG TPA: hypothetical protein VMS94_04180 [Acidobacteriota bacterium]|nr:hypothetical protein [Acidobacteriota bacterium]
MFEFLKSVYLDSSLALDVERKRLELKFSVRRIVPSLAAVAAA